MSFTTELLDSAIAAQNLASDAALSRALGMTKAAVSLYRSGKAFPSISTACKLAELSGVPHHEAVIGVNIDRTSTPEGLKFWRQIGREMQAHREGFESLQ